MNHDLLGKWMNELEKIILSEAKETQKDKHHMFLFGGQLPFFTSQNRLHKDCTAPTGLSPPILIINE